MASKLSEAARQEGLFSDDPQTPIVHNVPSPMTPAGGYSSDLHIDPKTGIFVKQEPLEPVPDDTENFLGSSANNVESEFAAALSRVEVSLKSGSIKQESVLADQTDPALLMPPPSGPPPHRKKNSKSSKNKIFKCCECHRAFKKVQKLVKHVERKHSSKNKLKSAAVRQSQILQQLANHEQQQVQQQQQQQQAQLQHQQVQQVEPLEIQMEQHLKEPCDVIIKTESPETLRDVAAGEKASLKLTPMGCPDCSLIFSAKDEMMRHFAQEPHKLAEGISINRCPGTVFSNP